MKPRLTLALAALCAAGAAFSSSAQGTAWSTAVYGPGQVSATLGNGQYLTRALALDAGGNSFVTGTATVAGVMSFITTKLSASGAILWQKTFTVASGRPASAASVAVDSAGNAIVTGPAIGNAGTGDVKVIKYAAADGSVLWEKRYDGGRDDAAYGVALDAAQNVIVAAESINAAGNADIRMLKFSGADGTLLWQRAFDSGRNDYVNDFALDAAGDVIVAGVSINAAGNTDLRMLKLSGAAGTITWQQSYDGGGDDQPYGLALDSGGNAMVVGFSMSAGRATALAMKFAGSDGRVLWRKNIDGGYGDYGQAVAVDAAGDPAFAIQSMNAAGNYDFRTVKVRSADGITSWNRTFDSGGDDFAYALAFDGAGNVVTVGSSAVTAGDTDWQIVRHAAANGAILDQASLAGAANGADDAFVAAATAGGVIVAGMSRDTASLQAARVAKFNYAAAALAAPVPSQPSGTIATLTPMYLWTPSAGATSYTLRVMNGGATVLSTSLTLVQALCPKNTGACGYTAPAPLAPGTAYTWQVSAGNSTATSAFSAPTAFTTSGSPTAPAVPVPGSPSGFITTLSPTYLWTPSPGASSYTIRVMDGGRTLFSTSLTLSQAMCPKNTGACGFVSPSPLSPGKTYTWQVSAGNSAGTSAFSAPRSFVTS
jgi:hypothetical protein